MTISSIHYRKVDGLIASAAAVCSNCLRAEDCNLSVDAGSTAHAVTPSTWHAMLSVCSRSPLLTLIDPACSHHTRLVATSRTSRRKHYSTWRHRALFLGKKDWAIVRAESVHVLHSAPTVLVIIIPIGDAQAHLDYELCRSAQSGPCGRSLSVAQQLVLETPTRTILPQVFPSTAHVLSDLPDCILHLSPTNHVPV